MILNIFLKKAIFLLMNLYFFAAEQYIERIEKLPQGKLHLDLKSNVFYYILNSALQSLNE